MTKPGPALAKALRATVDRGETGILFISHHSTRLLVWPTGFECGTASCTSEGSCIPLYVGVNGESTAYRASPGAPAYVLSDPC